MKGRSRIAFYTVAVAGMLLAAKPAYAQQSSDVPRAPYPPWALLQLPPPENSHNTVALDLDRDVSRKESLEDELLAVGRQAGIAIPRFLVNVLQMYSGAISDYNDLQKFEQSYFQYRLVKTRRASATFYLHKEPELTNLPRQGDWGFFLSVNVRVD